MKKKVEKWNTTTKSVDLKKFTLMKFVWIKNSIVGQKNC